MDLSLLIQQQTSIALTLINPRLYSLTDDKSIAYFHDEERSDLFFIHLNEYLNTTFISPLENKKVSVFQLMIDVCMPFKGNESFNKFIEEAEKVKTFFFKPRFYKYYISPYDINLEISFAELINFQSNYSKHSFYHLTIIKSKLKNIFENNNIEDFENEDYNDHLRYFKEAVLDDRLNFNQTMMLEVLGNFFLCYWDLINSNDNTRIRDSIWNFINKHGRLAKWDIEEPKEMNEVEQFHWKIKGRTHFNRERIEQFVPKTDKFLIEKETSEGNMIEKNK